MPLRTNALGWLAEKKRPFTDGSVWISVSTVLYCIVLYCKKLYCAAVYIHIIFPMKNPAYLHFYFLCTTSLAGSFLSSFLWNITYNVTFCVCAYVRVNRPCCWSIQPCCTVQPKVYWLTTVKDLVPVKTLVSRLYETNEWINFLALPSLNVRGGRDY